MRVAYHNSPGLIFYFYDITFPACAEKVSTKALSPLRASTLAASSLALLAALSAKTL